MATISGDISFNITPINRTFQTSLNEGVTSAVITVYGAKGANSSNNNIGGSGTCITVKLDDIDPYITVKPTLYIELGERGTPPNTLQNTTLNFDEKINGGYGSSGGGGGGGFTRVFYEYTPLGSLTSKKVVIIAGGGGGAGSSTNSNGGTGGVYINGIMTSGATAVGIGGGKGGNTYLIKDASGIGGINTIDGGENGFSMFNPLKDPSLNDPLIIIAGGGGNGVNGGGGGGGGFGGGGGGNSNGGGCGGSFTYGIDNIANLFIGETSINDITNGRVTISTNQFDVPTETFVGYPINIASRNNKSELVLGIINRAHVTQNDIYILTRQSDGYNPAFIAINNHSYFISVGKLYIFSNNISTQAQLTILVPYPSLSYTLIGNPYVTSSGIILAASNSGKMVMYRHDSINNRFSLLGTTTNTYDFSDTTRNVPLNTKKIICATSSNAYNLSNVDILKNSNIIVSTPNITFTSPETIIFFATSNEGAIKYFITNTADHTKFKINSENNTQSVDLDSSFNRSNLSKILTTLNYITFYTHNVSNSNIAVYYYLIKNPTPTSLSIRKFSFTTSNLNVVSSEMTSFENYVCLTVPSGLYIIKLPEVEELSTTVLLNWFIPHYSTSSYNFLPAPLIDASNNVFYGIGSMLYSVNIPSMRFNWSIDLLYDIVTEISIIQSNVLIPNQPNIFLLVGVGDGPLMIIKRITINAIQPPLLQIMPMSGHNAPQTHNSNMLSNANSIINNTNVNIITTESSVTNSYNVQSVVIDSTNSKYLIFKSKINKFADISNNVYVQSSLIDYASGNSDVNSTIAISSNNALYIHNSQKLYAIHAQIPVKRVLMVSGDVGADMNIDGLSQLIFIRGDGNTDNLNGYSYLPFDGMDFYFFGTNYGNSNDYTLPAKRIYMNTHYAFGFGTGTRAHFANQFILGSHPAILFDFFYGYNIASHVSQPTIGENSNGKYIRIVSTGDYGSDNYSLAGQTVKRAYEIYYIRDDYYQYMQFNCDVEDSVQSNRSQYNLFINQVSDYGNLSKITDGIPDNGFKTIFQDFGNIPPNDGGPQAGGSYVIRSDRNGNNWIFFPNMHLIL